MKIIVLHGDDIQKSYERLSKFVGEAKSRSWKISDFSIEEVENQSLFGEECFYVLKDHKLLTKIVLEKLKKYTGNLIVYNAGKISAPTLKNLGADKIELFELPQLIWKFLDNISIEGLHKLLETEAPEYLLAMMGWKFKQNYLKNPSIGNANLISELAEIDANSKLGKEDLLLSLDMFIIRHRA